MGNELQNAAERYLSGAEGKVLSEKRGEIQRIAASGDGEKVRAMLEKGGFEKAVRDGDAESVKKAVTDVLNTDAGARLVDKLREIMGQK